MMFLIDDFWVDAPQALDARKGNWLHLNLIFERSSK